jgi:type IV pilus assembly protein PilM
MSFDIDEAAIGYQVMRQTKEQTKVMVTVMPGPVRAEYEGAVRAAGYEPGVVLPATLASLAALNSDQAALVVRRNGLTLTTAITQGDELLLYRTLELPEIESAHQDELARSLSVAEAYYEDTLQSAPSAFYYVGPGGAEGLIHELHSGGTPAEQMPRVVDLVPVGVGALNAMPRGLSAGVIGALAQA